jgi:predicted regulator of Ras-like GTPase activity (Roadblock/LC7/MglB family)
LAPNLLDPEVKPLGPNMEHILKEINELPGVRGSFICDGHGMVLSSAVPEMLQPKVDTIGREVVQVIALLQILGEDTEVIDFLFSDGRILFNGLPDLSLIVFCDPNVDISMVRLKSHVTLAEIRRRGGFKKQVQKVFKAKRDRPSTQELDESYQQIIKKLRPLTK